MQIPYKDCDCDRCNTARRDQEVARLSAQGISTDLSRDLSLTILKSQIAKLQSSLLEQDYRINTLNERVSDLAEELYGIKLRLSKLEGTFNRLSTGQTNIINLLWQVEDRCKPTRRLVQEFVRDAIGWVSSQFRWWRFPNE